MKRKVRLGKVKVHFSKSNQGSRTEFRVMISIKRKK